MSEQEYDPYNDPSCKDPRAEIKKRKEFVREAMAPMSEDKRSKGKTCQSTPQNLRRNRIECWWTTCNKRAWFKDWCGWRYCPYHTYYTIRWGGGRIWEQIKLLKLYWGGV